MVSAKFEEAFTKVGTLTELPSQAHQLDLYAWNKIARGVDFAASKKPGMMDFKGKAKYNAWQKYVDEGVTPEDAEKRYIELVEELLKAEGKSL